MSHLHILLFVFVVSSVELTKSVPSPSKYIGFPLRKGYDSVFSFSLEMYNAEKYLDCAGNIYVRKEGNHLVFKYKNFDLFKRIGLDIKEINESVSAPLIINLDQDNKMMTPPDYDSWDEIDPRIVIKIFKYSFVSVSGETQEPGWETSMENEGQCKLEPKIFNGRNELHIKLFYNLEKCLYNSDGVLLNYPEHYRVIDLYVPESLKNVTRMEYNYRKKTDVADNQNTVNIQFEEYIKYEEVMDTEGSDT